MTAIAAGAVIVGAVLVFAALLFVERWLIARGRRGGASWWA